MTITDRISAADSMPRPSGGPVKSGSCRSECGIDVSIARTAGTRTKIPHNPYTIDGMAASSSVRKTSGCRSTAGQSSEMNTAMPSAIGVEMSRARTDE